MTLTVPFVEGAFYHVYNRGNNKENIFNEAGNYNYFLSLWKKHIEPVAETYCYVLLSNHFHALIRIRENLSLTSKASDVSRMPMAEQAFANLFNAYAKAYNKANNRTGKLFEERFRKKPVLDSGYLMQIVYYIHQNLQNHGFIDDFRLYPHSSYKGILSNKPTLLERDILLKWFDGKENFLKYHEEKHLCLKDLAKFLAEGS